MLAYVLKHVGYTKSLDVHMWIKVAANLVYMFNYFVICMNYFT